MKCERNKKKILKEINCLVCLKALINLCKQEKPISMLDFLLFYSLSNMLYQFKLNSININSV